MPCWLGVWVTVQPTCGRTSPLAFRNETARAYTSRSAMATWAHAGAANAATAAAFVAMPSSMLCTVTISSLRYRPNPIRGWPQFLLWRQVEGRRPSPITTTYLIRCRPKTGRKVGRTIVRKALSWAVKTTWSSEKWPERPATRPGRRRNTSPARGGCGGRPAWGASARAGPGPPVAAAARSGSGCPPGAR